MLTNILLLIVGFALLFLGAEGLVRGSASIALRLGLTPLAIGLTVVAFGTSMPELLVSVQASLSNHGDIAIGNVIGSNCLNIGVILGVTALICPIRVNRSVLKLDGPIMVGITLVVLIILLMGPVSRLTGFFLFSGLIGYVAFNLWMARRQVTADSVLEYDHGVPQKTPSLVLDCCIVLGGLALLALGSRLMVTSATELARLLGISEAIIGLTIVSAGTSLPELATSIIAAAKRQPDIAIGNVLGSNIFNLLGIIGAGALAKPLFAPHITTIDLMVMTLFSVGLLPLLWTGTSLRRWEGGILLLAYAGYAYYLWPVS